MLLILPALLLGAVALCAAKGKLGVAATIILTTVLTIVLFLASVFYVFELSLRTATTVTTDIAYYVRAYAKIDDIDGVKEVFPKAIPVDADDVSFTYHPQFLQGDERFKLSYTTTDEKLKEWTTLLESRAEWVGSNQAWLTAHNWGSNDDTGAIRYQLDWDGGYNHGEMCYVLINEETGRITFYYLDW